jgi:tetratricopeptide (TPR) repeat protein
MGSDVFHRILRKPDLLGTSDSLVPIGRVDWFSLWLAIRPKMGCDRAWAVRLCLAAVIVASFLCSWIFEGEARTSRRISSGRSKQSNKSGSRALRASRSGRSAGARRSSRSRSTTRRSSRSQGGRRASAPQHHGPTASQIRRQETSGSNDLEKRTDLERSYKAYDQGLSEMMAGNFADAAKHMNESYELYSDFHGSHDVLDSLYLYDLGQAAEAAGDISLAKSSYQRSLRRRPDFSDCCIRLSGLLTKNGETALALVYARRLADKNPQDPRAQLLLATMLEKAGFVEEGKAARENFFLLMKGGTVSKSQNQGQAGESGSEAIQDGEPKLEQKQSVPVEKEETDTESGVLKNSPSLENENRSPGAAVKNPDS